MLEASGVKRQQPSTPGSVKFQLPPMEGRGTLAKNSGMKPQFIENKGTITHNARMLMIIKEISELARILLKYNVVNLRLAT